MLPLNHYPDHRKMYSEEVQNDTAIMTVHIVMGQADHLTDTILAYPCSFLGTINIFAAFAAKLRCLTHLTRTCSRPSSLTHTGQAYLKSYLPTKEKEREWRVDYIYYYIYLIIVVTVYTACNIRGEA